MMGKKGLEFSVLVSMIICLVVGFLLLAFLFSLTTTLEKKTDIEACRASVLANAKIKGKTFSLFEASISCPAEKVSLGYTDKKMQAAEILRQMKDCWYKTGEGKIEVFGQPWTETISSCLVCSEFLLKENLDVAVIKDSMSNKLPFSDMTYLDYFSILNAPKAPSPDFFFVDIDEDPVTSKITPKPLTELKNEISYFVLFVRQSRSQLQALFSPLTTIVSSAIAALFGKEPVEDTTTFFIIPRDKVSSLYRLDICKTLYWETGKSYAKK